MGKARIRKSRQISPSTALLAWRGLMNKKRRHWNNQLIVADDQPPDQLILEKRWESLLCFIVISSRTMVTLVIGCIMTEMNRYTQSNRLFTRFYYYNAYNTLKQYPPGYKQKKICFISKLDIKTVNPFVPVLEWKLYDNLFVLSLWYIFTMHIH